MISLSFATSKGTSFDKSLGICLPICIWVCIMVEQAGHLTFSTPSAWFIFALQVVQVTLKLDFGLGSELFDRVSETSFSKVRITNTAIKMNTSPVKDPSTAA